MRLWIALALVWTHASLALAQTPQISVMGEGRIGVAPDMIILDFGVTAESRVARNAMDDVSKDVRAIFQRLVAATIAPADIKTVNLRLDPVWDTYSSQNRTQPPEIRGFVATNDVRVNIRDLALLGDVLDEVLDAGANRIGAIQFTLADPGPVRDAARRAAIRDARAKARSFSEEAGVSLGAVLLITQPGASVERPMMESARMTAVGQGAVSPGTLDIVERVTVTYALTN